MTKEEREALEALLAGIDRAMALADKSKKISREHVVGAAIIKNIPAIRAIRSLLATLDKPATRYDWSRAPKWAMWAATDLDGEWFWYEYDPRPLDDKGVWSRMGGRVLMFDGAVESRCTDWRDSLERRPNAP